MPASASVVNLYPALRSLDPATLAALSSSAEAWLNRFMGRALEAGTYTEVFSGQNQPLIFLSNSPVTEVTQVVVKTADAVNTYTMGSNYYQFTSDGRLHLSPQGFWNQLAGWRPGIQNIEVTYVSSGFDQPVQDTLIGSVMNWFNDQANRSGLVLMEVVGSYTYQMRTDIKGVPPSVMALLIPYRGIQAV